MEKKEKLEFDFPEMEFTDEEMKSTTDDTTGGILGKSAPDQSMAEMVEDVKSAIESGKESGEILSEKTDINGTPVSEIYKGMGMAAGLTIGMGKAAKVISLKLKDKVTEKINELDKKRKK